MKFNPDKYLGKSACLKYTRCPYLFKRIYVDGVEDIPGEHATWGQVLHYYYQQFYSWIDWSEFKIDPYRYFLSILKEHAPDWDTNLYIKNNLIGFAKYQSDVFKSFKLEYKTTDLIKSYFNPKDNECEYYMVYPDFRLYGTVDRKYREPKNITNILDWKSGHIPKSLLTEGKLSSPYPFQGNFYVLLDMLYYHRTEIVQKDGITTIDPFPKDNYRYTFVFTDSGQANERMYATYTGKPNIKVINRILALLDKIRNTLRFDKVKNPYACPTCRFFLECRDDFNFEILGDVLGSESSGSNDLHNDE
jgi:hypothetical protein